MRTSRDTTFHYFLATLTCKESVLFSDILMHTMRMEGRERSRELVSKIPRKNHFDVPTSHHTADQCNAARIFPRWRNSIRFFRSSFRQNIKLQTNDQQKLLSNIDVENIGQWCKIASPLPRSSPLKCSQTWMRGSSG